MIKLAITRFNNNTFSENRKWCESRQYNGCIYGSSTKIKKDINTDTVLIVFEMNNSTNEIEGIGIIKNKVINKVYNIYNDNNYNRYIYKSSYRIDKKKFTPETKEIIKKLEIILFKGKGHYKRGHGINILSENINLISNFNYIKYFKELFKTYI